MATWLRLLTVILGFASLVTARHRYPNRQVVPSGKDAQKRPNIVFILTDDQDLHLDSLSYMPHLKRHLLDQGTFFKRHYCTIAICCPSRVSLWTGKAAHNTNVTDVAPPYGGYPKFVSQGLNEAWLPLWLQEAGYNTFYTGKLFNAHVVNNYNSPYPSGFNGSDFLLDPNTYEYLNATLQRNRDPPMSYEGQYSTDIIANKSYGFLDDAIANSSPFFLTIAPIGPHSNLKFKELGVGGSIIDSIITTPPVPAERHKNLFKDVVVPRTRNFNPDEPSGVSWIASLPKQNQSVVDSNDEFHRNRLRALQSVDEIVDGVIKRLSDANILDNTYIFYSSDNGFHIGQHRMQPGKSCGFEEDINVPLIVRGPGVAKGKVSDIVTSHTDLAPTFLTLANGKIRDDFDGTAIPVRSSSSTPSQSASTRSEHVNIEYWGAAATSEGNFGRFLFTNNTYKGLRVIGTGYNLYYSVWCTGDHQLYDLNADPFEMDNLYTKNYTSTTIDMDTGEHSVSFTNDDPPRVIETPNQVISLQKLIPRLDALLLILKTCKARTCTHPWESLHPKGDVHTLREALNLQYDNYYEIELKDWRVNFSKCEPGYILGSEGPLGPNAPSFGSSAIQPRGGDLWSEFV